MLGPDLGTMASSTVPSTSATTLDDVRPSTRPHPLDGVPREYIIDSLRKLAPKFYNDVESSDCTISAPFLCYLWPQVNLVAI